jgi:dienelactone hydrolase
LRRARHAKECYLTAVGRPHGLAIVFRAGIEVKQRLRAEIVDADEAMVRALADKGEGVAVRSPNQSGDVTSSVQLGFCFGGVRTKNQSPYLSV